MVDKNKVKELKAEIAEFKKEEKVVYDMLAVYEHLAKGNDIDKSIAGTVLVENLLKSLESCKGSVPYKSDQTVDFVVNSLIDRIYEICGKYQDIPEVVGALNKFHGDWAKEEACAYTFLDHNKKENNNEPFNIITMIGIVSDIWALKFLVSNLPFEVRLEMFGDLLSKSDSFERIWTSHISDTKETSKKKIEKKKQELIEAYVAGKCKSCMSLEDYTLNLIKLGHYGTFHRQYKDVFDFNPLYYRINSNNSMIDGRVVSTVGLIAFQKDNIVNAKELYNDPQYLQIDEGIRANNDIVILNTLDFVSKFNRKSSLEFITWPNFKMDAEKARVLGTIIYGVQANQFAILNDVRKDIYDAIISRAKNKEEYREMSECARLFLRYSDYSKTYAKEIEAKKQKRLEQDRITESRINLTLTLREVLDTTINNTGLDAPVRELKLVNNAKED